MTKVVAPFDFLLVANPVNKPVSTSRLILFRKRYIPSANIYMDGLICALSAMCFYLFGFMTSKAYRLGKDLLYKKVYFVKDHHVSFEANNFYKSNMENDHDFNYS